MTERKRTRELKNARITWLEGFRTKSLDACIQEIKRSGDMRIVNGISDHDFGVSTIVQFTPNGSLVAWARSDFAGDEVKKVFRIKLNLLIFFTDRNESILKGGSPSLGNQQL